VIGSSTMPEPSFKIADGAIAVTGRAFGYVDGMVDFELPAGKRGKFVQQSGEPLIVTGSLDQGCRGNRAGIDDRIEWPVVRHVKNDLRARIHK
jgi:hypothetical protein